MRASQMSSPSASLILSAGTIRLPQDGTPWTLDGEAILTGKIEVPGQVDEIGTLTLTPGFVFCVPTLPTLEHKPFLGPPALLTTMLTISAGSKSR